MKDLSVAYAVQRKAKGGMINCAHGGALKCSEGCYAQGGEVKGEKNPDSSDMVKAVMAKRKMAAGGMVDSDDDADADFLSDAHDVEAPNNMELSDPERDMDGTEDSQMQRKALLSRILSKPR